MSSIAPGYITEGDSQIIRGIAIIQQPGMPCTLFEEAPVAITIPSGESQQLTAAEVGDCHTHCTDHEDCGEIGYCSRNQEDDYPPGGKGIGDACDCEGNFNCDIDTDVDGSDAFTFKSSFGRSPILNPCTRDSPCHGDFNCDHDCDGTDAARFKQDFGRSAFSNPCPACTAGVEWCQYQ